MSNINKINSREFESLKSMSPKEYGDFLDEKLKRIKNDEYYSKYKIITNNELFRFFIYPPSCGTEVYEETKEQRKERLRLKKEYKVIYSKNIEEVVSAQPFYETKDDYIDINTVQRFLGISRSTIILLQDKNGENNFKIETITNKLYIEKQSLLKYLSKRHYETTNLNFENKYLEIKALKTAVKNGKRSQDKERLIEIINSDEYKSIWNKYFEEVPENLRVYKNYKKEITNGVEIYVQEGTDFLDTYNPNIKICEKEISSIPKLHSISFISAMLGVVDRTIIRYCELGYLTHYKIGAKYMISLEDFNRSKGLIDDKKEKTKANVGRKRRIETLFTDDMFENADLEEEFKENENYIEIKTLLTDKKKIKADIEALKKDMNKEDIILKKENISEIKSIIKKDEAILARIEKSLAKNKRLFVFKFISNKEKVEKMNKQIDEYYDILKSLKKYNEDLIKAENKGEEEIVTQLKYMVSIFNDKFEKQKKIVAKGLFK